MSDDEAIRLLVDYAEDVHYGRGGPSWAPRRAAAVLAALRAQWEEEHQEIVGAAREVLDVWSEYALTDRMFEPMDRLRAALSLENGTADERR